MLRKFFSAVVLVPLGLVLLLAAVANRQAVTVSLDPFLSGERAFSVTQPLFVILLVTLMIGVVVGGVTTWLRQGKWRRAARAAQAESRALRREVVSLRQTLEAERAAEMRRVTPSIAYRPPPAA